MKKRHEHEWREIGGILRRGEPFEIIVQCEACEKRVSLYDVPPEPPEEAANAPES